jgi:hypothetical protein
MYKCSELLLFGGDAPPQYPADIVAANDEHDFVKVDANCQRRLPYLLWAWTDKDVDWPGFLIISKTDPLVGSKMWHIAILTYQINMSSNVILHGNRLRMP